MLESCAELLWHGEPRTRRTAAAGEAAYESGMSAGDMRVDRPDVRCKDRRMLRLGPRIWYWRSGAGRE